MVSDAAEDEAVVLHLEASFQGADVLPSPGEVGLPLAACEAGGKDVVGGAPSGPFPADDLEVEELERRLQGAVATEDFAEAIRLRDIIRDRSLEGEVALLAVNSAFFEAYQARDLAQMGEIWHKGDHSCCIHISSRPVHGYQAIMESFANVFNKSSRRRGECVRQIISVRDKIGRVVWCENRNDGSQVAITNHFEYTQHGWRLCCHQVSSISKPKKKSSLAQMIDGVSNWLGSRWRERKRVPKQLEQDKVFLPRLADISVR